MGYFLETTGYNFGDYIEEIEKVGAVSLPIVTPQGLEVMLAEVKGLPFFSSVSPDIHTVFRFNSFWQEGSIRPLVDELEAFIEDGCTGIQSPFSKEIYFDEVEDLRYKIRAGGLPTHKDGPYRDLTVFVPLQARSRLLMCNAGGGNEREIDYTPGRVVFMKEKGFRGFLDNQSHRVELLEHDKEKYSRLIRQAIYPTRF